MEYLRYILKFFYHIRWWIITLPLIAALIAIFATRHLPATYDVKATIYTGIISGYNIESNIGVSISQPSNGMDNLLNIITSESTLKKVAIRLYTKCMIHGSAEQDNNYMQAASFRQWMGTPAEVQSLIDKNDEEKTVKALLAYERPNKNNFIYGILNFYHPYFSVSEIAKRIKVARIGASDMIQINYSANDPGIAYNTLQILNSEFMEQYQDLRFGETNNVIKFFEEELARLSKILKEEEDSLTSYNIGKRIINYGEQTKQVTIMDAGHQMKLQQLALDYNSTKALADFFESKLGEQAKEIRKNSEFITSLNNINELNSKIANLNFIKSDDAQTTKETNKYRTQLKQAEDKLTSLSSKFATTDKSTDDLSEEGLVSQWLGQIVMAEKVKAELNTMETQRQKLDKDFVYYSPIGSTLKRKERSIGFVESSYMSMLGSLNSARLRQKNLQMTSATLRVTNPPLFPLNAQPTKRKIIVLSVFIIALIFIIGYFLLLEIMDRTLRNKIRAERITGGKVIGAFPGESVLRYRRYNKVISEIAIQYLAKSLSPYFKPNQTNIINLMSTESKDGKSYIGELLTEYWSAHGFNVKKITYNEDFNSGEKKYIMAQSIKDIYEAIDKEDILIIEYPALKENSVPPALLQEGTVNLIIANANRVWKGTDQASYEDIDNNTEKNAPLFIYLNKVKRDDLEEFVGQLPPYTKARNLIFRLSQFGLTGE